MKLRYTIVQLALDIEHYTKLEILRIMETQNEDGYEICSDYINSLDDKQYSILKTELNRCSTSEYCKELSNKYDLVLPVWVFLEIIPIGRLVAFYGYCAEKFKDKKMKEKSFYVENL